MLQGKLLRIFPLLCFLLFFKIFLKHEALFKMTSLRICPWFGLGYMTYQIVTLVKPIVEWMTLHLVCLLTMNHYLTKITFIWKYNHTKEFYAYFIIGSYNSVCIFITQFTMPCGLVDCKIQVRFANMLIHETLHCFSHNKRNHSWLLYIYEDLTGWHIC